MKVVKKLHLTGFCFAIVSIVYKWIFDSVKIDFIRVKGLWILKSILQELLFRSLKNL